MKRIFLVLLIGLVFASCATDGSRARRTVEYGAAGAAIGYALGGPKVAAAGAGAGIIIAQIADAMERTKTHQEPVPISLSGPVRIIRGSEFETNDSLLTVVGKELRGRGVRTLKQVGSRWSRRDEAIPAPFEAQVDASRDSEMAAVIVSIIDTTSGEVIFQGEGDWDRGYYNDDFYTFKTAAKIAVRDLH